jgi:type IV secretion system protein TrbL
MIAIGFPNPIGWAIDRVTDFVGGVASEGFEMIIGGLVAWVVDAVVWVVGGIFEFFLDSTDPNVQADWFVSGDGPYATTAGIGASLLLLFVLAGIVQGTLSGEVGGMLRRIGLELPISVAGMVGLVTVTQILVRLTDALSEQILGNFQDDIAEFGTVVATLTHLSGGTSTAFVIFVLGLVTVLAGLVLVAELVVRAALIYIVVALAPLVYAARLWPATKGASRKLLDLLVALIVSKLVIAIALSVAAAAAVGTASGGEVTALPEPEVFAEDSGGSVAQAAGILLTAAAAFGVSAFSPLLVARLLPMTEAALVAHGVKGAPVRAGHQGAMAVNTMQMITGSRYSRIAQGKAGAGAASAAGGGVSAAEGAKGAAGAKAASSAGGGAASGAGAVAGGAGAPAGPAGVAVAGASAGAGAAGRGARAGTGTAEAAADAAGDDRRESTPRRARSERPGRRTPPPRTSRPRPPSGGNRPEPSDGT